MYKALRNADLDEHEQHPALCRQQRVTLWAPYSLLQVNASGPAREKFWLRVCRNDALTANAVQPCCNPPTRLPHKNSATAVGRVFCCPALHTRQQPHPEHRPGCAVQPATDSQNHSSENRRAAASPPNSNGPQTLTMALVSGSQQTRNSGRSYSPRLVAANSAAPPATPPTEPATRTSGTALHGHSYGLSDFSTFAATRVSRGHQQHEHVTRSMKKTTVASLLRSLVSSLVLKPVQAADATGGYVDVPEEAF